MTGNADVDSPEAVIDAVYRLLSGRADEPRDWPAFANLCLPDARIVPVSVVDGSVVTELFGVEEYARSRTPMLAATDFYERGVDRRVERRGSVAHVWSMYEARRSLDEPPFMHGVVSVQMLRRDDRWWIVSALWEAAPHDHGGH